MPREPARFPATFWLINGLELGERAAYYGMVSVLSFHLVTQRGYPSALFGAMVALLQALLYFVPPLAAPLAEKYGYRRSLVAAFAVILLGYIALGSAPSLRDPLGPAGSLLLGVLLLGLGAGAFKPVVAAAIAGSTTMDQRNLGFNIYYAFINLGGFLGPLAIGLLVPVALYGVVFFVSAALITANLVVTLLFYREPAPPQRGLRVRGALARLLEVRRDRLFLALLVIDAGFWFMYAQYQFYLPLYMTDFAVMPSWFNVALLATINPGTIILAGPVLGKLTQRRASFGLVILGTALYVVGVALYGLVMAVPLFLAGVVLASVGEVLQHPSYLSYASKVAPQDRVAVYLGLAFIPLGIGFSFGTAAGGVLYATYAEQLHEPARYWSIVAAIGLATMVGLLLLDRRLARARAPLPARPRRALARVAPVGALLVIPLLLLAGLAPGAQPFHRFAAPGASVGPLDEASLPTVRGETREGAATDADFALPEGARRVTLTLAWRDEDPGAPGATNAPDRLRLSLERGSQLLERGEGANPPNGAGRVTLAANASAGTYRAVVEVLDAGDTQLGPLPLAPDTTTAWSLEVRYAKPR